MILLLYKQVDNPHAIERPKANPDAFTRQNSLRGTGNLQLPFKRNTAAYTSLRPGELPSFQQQKLNGELNLTKTSMLSKQPNQLNNPSNGNLSQPSFNSGLSNLITSNLAENSISKSNCLVNHNYLLIF